MVTRTGAHSQFGLHFLHICARQMQTCEACTNIALPVECSCGPCLLHQLRRRNRGVQNRSNRKESDSANHRRHSCRSQTGTDRPPVPGDGFSDCGESEIRLVESLSL